MSVVSRLSSQSHSLISNLNDANLVINGFSFHFFPLQVCIEFVLIVVNQNLVRYCLHYGTTASNDTSNRKSAYMFRYDKVGNTV